MLTGFERDYRRYVESQEAEDSGQQPALTTEERRELRRDLLRRVDAAERAMSAVDKTMIFVPPRPIGGPLLTSLSDQLFAHETPTFGHGEPPFMLPNGLLDTMTAALGALEDRLAEAQQTENGLDELGAQMDQMGEDFARKLERVDFAVPERRKPKTRPRFPTLWGHMRRVPGWIAIAADFITVGGVLIGAAKLLGLW